MASEGQLMTREYLAPSMDPTRMPHPPGVSAWERWKGMRITVPRLMDETTAPAENENVKENV